MFEVTVKWNLQSSLYVWFLKSLCLAPLIGKPQYKLAEIYFVNLITKPGPAPIK